MFRFTTKTNSYVIFVTNLDHSIQLMVCSVSTISGVTERKPDISGDPPSLIKICDSFSKCWFKLFLILYHSLRALKKTSVAVTALEIFVTKL